MVKPKEKPSEISGFIKGQIRCSYKLSKIIFTDVLDTKVEGPHMFPSDSESEDGIEDTQVEDGSIENETILESLIKFWGEIKNVKTMLQC